VNHRAKMGIQSAQGPSDESVASAKTSAPALILLSGAALGDDHSARIRPIEFQDFAFLAGADLKFKAEAFALGHDDRHVEPRDVDMGVAVDNGHSHDSHGRSVRP
jgi:hypothetical protein